MINIIGGGISGLMCAYTILENNPEQQVTIFEKGNAIEKRHCPVSKSTACRKCNPCSIMNGIAGAGAFSDGKFILDPTYGGWLQDELGFEETQGYIARVDEVLQRFGDDSRVYEPSDRLRRKCLEHDIVMQQSRVKHIGTENNLRVMRNLIEYLEDKVRIVTNHEIKNINELDGTVVIAVGRSGSGLVKSTCKNRRIRTHSNQVDIGVRVELKRDTWREFEEEIYEPKLVYRTEKYKDLCRMFCFNGGGIVVNENTNGTITVNGHSYSDESRKTDNSNFAVLSTINFTEPFDEPSKYVNHISTLANMISDGSIVQRFGDLVSGQRSTEGRLRQSSVTPTLKSTAGDLSLVLPKRQLDNVIQMIYKLNEVAPGTANYDTLLYGIEAKYYSVKPENKNFQIDDRLYCIGDCSGYTRSLSQAGAHGIYVGEIIARL